jgi:hypothetical protein
MAKTSGASWAFVLGVVLAVILGFVNWYMQRTNPAATTNPIFGIILVVLGLIIGFANITAKEAQPFMIAGAVLVIVANMAGNVFQPVWFIPHILDAVIMLFTPAVIITAIKAVWGMAASK